MSAAQAKRVDSEEKEKTIETQTKSTSLRGEDVADKHENINPSEKSTIKILHNLVIDGKVVKASYNSGVKERVVHVTEIKKDNEENRSRFIIGSQPTILDRKGEWGLHLVFWMH